MPKRWAMVDGNFPSFTGEESPTEQVRMLVDYMFVLVEELKYQLENLDPSNWNSSALKDFQTDTTADVIQQTTANASQLEMLKSVTEELGSRLKAMEYLTGRMTQAEINISYLEKDLTELTDVVELLEQQMTDLQDTMDEITGVITVDSDTGELIIGAEDREVRLLGTVYINGKLVEWGDEI